MTVASLWKALDRAGCGKAVGVQEILDHHGIRKATNPWNYNQMASSSMAQHSPTLAIDLSIWICESLNSSVMAENHADPTMHLVFSRTIKLLNLGIKLIGVIEGKKRRQGRDCEGEKDEFQKRRGGTRFWRACERCELMLEILGVPVVRAKAEGEALCALLNDKGIVDGVISNDGDCFLFGAKVLYTKFSIENLNQGKVMRYDADSLVACLDDDDHDEYDWKARMDCTSPPDIVKLSRSDLVVFAVITGSDMAGNGISKVGCRKALRFIRKCQMDNPLRSNTAAYDEIISWSKVAKGHCGTLETHDGEAKCSFCHHGGTKARHLKYGCELCGTSPGESCFLVSPGGKFRQSLRTKALTMNPKFDPEPVSNAYYNPNDNQVPVRFVGLRSQDVLMETPDLHRFLESPLIVRGRSSSESRAYVLQSLSQLMARTELSHLYESTRARENRHRHNIPRSNKNKPLPLKIVKEVTRSSLPCFQVLWKVSATTTDSKGNPIDEYEFSTIEDQMIVKKCFHEIVEKFLLEEKERVKQGKAEQERRKAFLDDIKTKLLHEGNAPFHGETLKLGKGKREFFQKGDNGCLRGQRGIGKEKYQSKGHLQGSEGLNITRRMGDDAAMLFHASAPQPCKRHIDIENGSIVTVSTLSCATSQVFNPGDSDGNLPPPHHYSHLPHFESPYKFELMPSHLFFLSTMATFEISDHIVENRDSRETDIRLGEHMKWSALTSIDRHDVVATPSQPPCKPRPLMLKLSDSPSVLFGNSPCIKRSRFSNGAKSTQPPSPGYYISYDDKIDIHVVHNPRQSADYEVFQGRVDQSNHRNKSTPSPSINFDANTGDRRMSTITNVDFAKEIERMLTTSDFNDSWLVESFAGVSIHSIQSPRTKRGGTRPCNMLSPRPHRTDIVVEPRVSMEQRLQPFIQEDFAPIGKSMAVSNHEITNITCTNAKGDGIVEVAMAKWERKSRLAKFENENMKFVQEQLLHERFDWL